MNYIVVRAKIEQIAKSEKADIDWLFCEVLGVRRSNLNSNLKVTKKQQKVLEKYAKKLSKGMPLSLVLGKTEFYGLPMFVNKHVLTPRPETEELADYVIKDIAGKQHVSVLDLCCGSGCIGLAIAKNTSAKVTGADISAKAIKVAKRNANINSIKISFVKSNMLKNVWGNFNYIVCNPPYIAFGDNMVAPDVNKHEPHLALYAPNNGYYFYQYLAQHAGKYMLMGSKLCLEVGINQASTVAKLFSGFASTQIIKDMQGIERFVIVTK